MPTTAWHRCLLLVLVTPSSNSTRSLHSEKLKQALCKFSLDQQKRGSWFCSAHCSKLYQAQILIRSPINWLVVHLTGYLQPTCTIVHYLSTVLSQSSVIIVGWVQQEGRLIFSSSPATVCCGLSSVWPPQHTMTNSFCSSFSKQVLLSHVPVISQTSFLGGQFG
jgi:hypothetical protein